MNIELRHCTEGVKVCVEEQEIDGDDVVQGSRWCWEMAWDKTAISSSEGGLEMEWEWNEGVDKIKAMNNEWGWKVKGEWDEGTDEIEARVVDKTGWWSESGIEGGVVEETGRWNEGGG